MPRILLTFRLSGASQLRNLMAEFVLHDDVVAYAPTDGMLLTVETDDSAPAMWDVRATVNTFDDRAVEVTETVGGPPI